MTREEAIKALSFMEHIESVISTYGPGERREDTTVRELKEAFRMAAAALRAQQSPAKPDRSRWERCKFCKEELFVKRIQYLRPLTEPITQEQEIMDKLAELTGIAYCKLESKFCPMCGRPLTEEAWAKLERRINDG